MRKLTIIVVLCFFFCKCLTSKQVQRDSYFDDLKEAQSYNQNIQTIGECVDGNCTFPSEKNGNQQQTKSAIQTPEGYGSSIINTPEGKKVTIFYKKESEAVGFSHKYGRLMNGRQLPKKGVGYIHVGKGSYGTDETINYLLYAINKVRERYNGTSDIVIGSLSKLGGGKLRPHKSHQNGRDVDIGYFKKGNVQLTCLEKIPFDEMDIEKTWYLIEQLLLTNFVEFIFMNYDIQEIFYEHAKSIGYSDAELDKIFQYPKGRKTKSGIIRHSRGHLGHFHLRFKCSLMDKECK